LVMMCALFGVVLMFGGCAVCARNSAVALEEAVGTAKSGIDVQLSNRFNKLTELAACVKKYDEHEYRTLVDVIEKRGKNMSAAEAKQCIAAFSRVEERYPDLKSQRNYQNLMQEVALTENHLAAHKKAYNESVREYRRHCQMFPANAFLSLFGYAMKDFAYYEAEAGVKDDKPMELF